MGDSRREVPPTETNPSLQAGAAQRQCPYLEPAQADRILSIPGYCKGLHQDLRMIPSVDEYLAMCSTADHVSCPIYRTRGGENSLEAWLMARYRQLGLIPAGRERPPRPGTAEATATPEIKT